MKLPWTQQTGLAKAAAILATGLIVSLGLCGLNFALMIPMQGDNDVLMATGWLELAGIVLCGGGLLVLALISLYKVILQAATGRSK